MPDSKRTLLFRCDATAETGLGHFARCRDLARLLTRDDPELKIDFLGCLNPEAQGDIEEQGWGFVAVPADAPVAMEQLRELSGACVLDSYRIAPEDYLSPLLAGLRVGAFDDLGLAARAPLDLVLNARVSAPTRFAYAARAQALGTAFLGPSLELIELRRRHFVLPVRSEVELISVFVGGTDRHGAGITLVRALLDVFPRARVRWVGGETDLSRVECLPFRRSIAGALDGADLVIAGGGRLKYEAGFSLVPVASVSQTPLQEEDTQELGAKGLCQPLGVTEGLSVETLRPRLEPLSEHSLRSALRLAQSLAFPEDAPKRLTTLVRSALDLECSPPHPESPDLQPHQGSTGVRRIQGRPVGGRGSA